MNKSEANLQYQKVVERLLAPHPEFSYENHEFMIDLMYEYLKRMAAWHTLLKLTPENSLNIWPFDNLIAVIAPEFAIDLKIESDMDSLQEHEWRRPGEKRLVHSMLYWAKYRSQVPLLCDQILDDPYEPALMFFEIGGYFWTEHGFICVGAAMLTQKTAAHWLPKESQNKTMPYYMPR